MRSVNDISQACHGGVLKILKNPEIPEKNPDSPNFYIAILTQIKENPEFFQDFQDPWQA